MCITGANLRALGSLLVSLCRQKNSWRETPHSSCTENILIKGYGRYVTVCNLIKWPIWLSKRYRCTLWSKSYFAFRWLSATYWSKCKNNIPEPVSTYTAILVFVTTVRRHFFMATCSLLWSCCSWEGAELCVSPRKSMQINWKDKGRRGFPPLGQ